MNTGPEIKANRGGEERGPRKACVHRSFSPDHSLKEFRKMRSGDYKPNEIILRMKQDLEDGNPQMWDLVAYRVLEASHHRTGTDWKIYPTYDFTHCLVDSFENITFVFYRSMVSNLDCSFRLISFLSAFFLFTRHSLCTTEFIQSRVSYEWLCHALEIYTPKQTEYGRLNLEGTVMSKRKIMKLVQEGHVEGWDDPRLYTLIALRRRGVPPEAILKFVNSLGVATSVTNIATHRFEQTIRQHLELVTPRLMMVLDPIKVIITNLSPDHREIIERPLHPKVPEMGTIQTTFTQEIYIERSDFSEVDSDDFFRLTPSKPVGLFQVPYPIRFQSLTTDPLTGKVESLMCEYVNEVKITKANKPKAYIHWISAHHHLKIEETRIYKPLFKSANPAGLDNFLNDVDQNSLEIVKGSMIENGMIEVSKKLLNQAQQNQKTKQAEVGLENVRFQGMRTAYFTIDKTSNLSRLLFGKEGQEAKEEEAKVKEEKWVLNWIVSLKEDAGKKNV